MADLLSRTALAGATPQLLRGRQIALLIEGGDDAASESFTRATGDLGARVARISLIELDTGARDSLVKALGIMGQLYDAIACIGLPAERVAWLERKAGIPVCGDLEPSGIAAAGLVGDEGRSYLLQAMLVHRLETSEVGSAPWPPPPGASRGSQGDAPA
jgi:hypothetical protein